MNAPERSSFLHWRSPRRGTANPERLTNPVWQWALATRAPAHSLNTFFDGPSSLTDGPCFSGDRWGSNQLVLPDGREVWIAGVHEDFYDPDFFIYNDVFVRDGDALEIYGYPSELFPPTDYASATLVGDQIVLIGNLGYAESRADVPPQVLLIDTNSWAITPWECSGDDPGWICRHTARLSPTGRSIFVEGGSRFLSPDQALQPNEDLFELDLQARDWRIRNDLRQPQWSQLRGASEWEEEHRQAPLTNADRARQREWRRPQRSR